MSKKVFQAAVLVLLVMMTMLCGCGKKDAASMSPVSAPGDSFVNTAGPGLPDAEAGTEETLTDEQALSAIRNYCYALNPDLESIVEDGKYPVYWDISSGDEKETVVLFRSYTGALVRYYIDRVTGDTYVTEFVPGITQEEQRTGESFNVRDYF